MADNRCPRCGQDNHTREEHLNELLILKALKNRMLGFRPDDFVAELCSLDNRALTLSHLQLMMSMKLICESSWRSRLKGYWMMGAYEREMAQRGLCAA